MNKICCNYKSNSVCRGILITVVSFFQHMEAWTAVVDEGTGGTYYYNTETNETAWELPEGAQVRSNQQGDGEITTGPTGGTEWTEVYDEGSGSFYYVDYATGETRWDNPNEADGGSLEPTNASPSAWTEVSDENGNIYYYNSVSGESSWDKPDETNGVGEGGGVRGAGLGSIAEDDEGEEEQEDEEDNDEQAGKRSSIKHPEDEGDDEWEEVVDEASGSIYYANRITGATQWENPFSTNNNDMDDNDGDAALSRENGDANETIVPGNEGVPLTPTPTPTASRSNSLIAGGAGTRSRSGSKLGGGSGSFDTVDGNASLVSDVSHDSLSNTGLTSSMSLYDSGALNLPKFASGTSLGAARGANKSKQRNGYASAPDTFLADFLTHKNNPQLVPPSGKSGNDERMSSNKVLGDSTTSAAHLDGEDAEGEQTTHDGDNEENKKKIKKESTGESSPSGKVSADEDQADDEEEEDEELTAAQKHTLNQFELIDAILQTHNGNTSHHAATSGTTVAALAVSEMLLTTTDIDTYRSGYVLSCLTKKLASFDLEKYAEAHFQYDRRATGGGNGVGSSLLVKKLLSYQSEPGLLRPLTTAATTSSMGSSTAVAAGGGGSGTNSSNNNSGVQADAIRCFQLICAFMSNKTTSVTQIDIAVNLLRKLIAGPAELHEEAFCQICKQTRKNPSSDSIELGWQLMLLCLSCIPPSKRLLPYLINYIAATLNKLESAANTAAASAGGATSSLPNTINSGTALDTGTSQPVAGTGAGTGAGAGGSDDTAALADALASALSVHSNNKSSNGSSSNGNSREGATVAAAGSIPDEGQANLSTTATATLTSGAAAAVLMDENANIMKFVILALRACMPAAASTARREVPTRAEIRSLLVGESLEITCATMLTQPQPLQFTFQVDSYTTMQKLLSMMCEKLGILPSNKQIFSLYENIVEEAHTTVTTHSPASHHHAHVAPAAAAGGGGGGGGGGHGGEAQGGMHGHGPGLGLGATEHLANSNAHTHVVDSSTFLLENLLHPNERVLDWMARSQRQAAQHHQIIQHPPSHSSASAGMVDAYGGTDANHNGTGMQGSRNINSHSSDHHQHHHHSHNQHHATITSISTTELVVVHSLVCKARYMFRLSDHQQDKVTMDLLYAQAQSDILSAKYMYSTADALILAAFVLQETCGDYVSGTRHLADVKGKHGVSLAQLVSPMILQQCASTSSSNASHHTNAQLHRHHNSNNTNSSMYNNSHAQQLKTASVASVMTLQEAEARIISCHKALIGTSKQQARHMYLTYISCWKVFGATFFVVSGQMKNYEDLVLSVSVDCILLIDPVTRYFIAEYSYADIYSWGHSFDSFVLITGSKASQIKSYFKSSQGKAIDHLVSVYHDHYLNNNNNTSNNHIASTSSSSSASSAGASAEAPSSSSSKRQLF